MDTAPHASALFEEIHALVDPRQASPLVHGDRSETALPMSWDSFNPVQAFFDVYAFAVDRPDESGSLPKLEVTTLADSYDKSSDVRKVTIRVDHEGLIWPVLAFDAEIVGWPFNADVPRGHRRHHLKGVSELGYESYEVSLDVRGCAPIRTSKPRPSLLGPTPLTPRPSDDARSRVRRFCRRRHVAGDSPDPGPPLARHRPARADRQPPRQLQGWRDRRPRAEYRRRRRPGLIPVGAGLSTRSTRISPHLFFPLHPASRKRRILLYDLG
jgi:hypothetical protein